jgi:uncharacterized membrane protein
MSHKITIFVMTFFPLCVVIHSFFKVRVAHWATLFFGILINLFYICQIKYDHENHTKNG